MPRKVAACPRRPGPCRKSAARTNPHSWHDCAIKIDSPLLQLRRGETQALEGNRHPHDESAAGDLALRIPHRIEGRIEVSVHLIARSLGPDCIPLDSQRSGLENIGAALIVKGIEHDLNFVIVINILAWRHAGAYFFRIVRSKQIPRKDFSGRSRDRRQSAPKPLRRHADFVARIRLPSPFAKPFRPAVSSPENRPA